MVGLYDTVTSVYSSITMVYDTYKYSIHVTLVYDKYDIWYNYGYMILSLLLFFNSSTTMVCDNYLDNVLSTFSIHLVYKRVNTSGGGSHCSCWHEMIHPGLLILILHIIDIISWIATTVKDWVLYIYPVAYMLYLCPVNSWRCFSIGSASWFVYTLIYILYIIVLPNIRNPHRLRFV